MAGLDRFFLSRQETFIERVFSRHFDAMGLPEWRQLPAAQFMAVFGPYAARIDQILGRFDAAELAAAATEVGDTDDEIPLRPEELTA